MSIINSRIISPNRYDGRIERVDLWVMHDMEAPEGPLTAENVMSYLANPSVRASAHFGIDQDSCVMGVEPDDTAWHAPGANANGIGVEHAGYARYTRADWLTATGRAQLDISAKLFLEVGVPYGIRPVYLDTEALARGERFGITGHRNVSEAFQTSDHWDPGYEFPWDYFIPLVSGASAPVPAPIHPTMKEPMDFEIRTLPNGKPEVIGWDGFPDGAYAYDHPYLVPKVTIACIKKNPADLDYNALLVGNPVPQRVSWGNQVVFESHGGFTTVMVPADPRLVGRIRITAV